MSVFRDASPIIYVEDLAASLTFYRDRLGFAETYRFPPGDAAEFVGLSLGGAGGSSLALAAATDGQIGAHGQPIRPRVGRQFELCVYTDDVDRAIEELRSAEVPVLVEPVNQPWGERMAYVADPSGHPVMVCAPLPTPSPSPSPSPSPGPSPSPSPGS
jgi:lactoylglutathione lyase